MGGQALVDSYTATLAQLKALMQAEDFLTLSVDGWTNCRKQSVYAVTVTMGSDRRTFLLHTVDLSAISHTGANLAGMYKVIGFRQGVCLQQGCRSALMDFHRV